MLSVSLHVLVIVLLLMPAAIHTGDVIERMQGAGGPGPAGGGGGGHRGTGGETVHYIKVEAARPAVQSVVPQPVTPPPVLPKPQPQPVVEVPPAKPPEPTVEIKPEIKVLASNQVVESMLTSVVIDGTAVVGIDEAEVPELGATINVRNAGAGDLQ